MRTKKWMLLLCMVFSLSAIAGCGTSDDPADSVTTEKENSSDTTKDVTETISTSDSTEDEAEERNTSDTTENVDDETESEEEFSFAEVSNREFWFGSGAGAWCTVLHIHEDGTFDGEYHDSDMGDIGGENPNGVMYLSNFTGKFMQPEKVNDYTYSFQIESLKLEQEPNTEEIKEGIRYIYSEPYGLDKAERILLYLPGAPLEELPEGFRSWVGYHDLSAATDTELTFYGLYNETPGYGFSSYEAVDVYEEMKKELESVEETARSLEEKIQTGELTQIEMNQTSAQIYQIWDDELNRVWNCLKSNLDKERMEQITTEEREWISYKESEIANAGAEAEGGSMQALLENDKGAELTKARVYELVEYLK